MSPFLCACGFAGKKTIVEVMRHIEAGECPKNPPHDPTRHIAWTQGIGHRKFVKPMTEEKKVELAARNADPEVKAKRAAERKQRRELRRRMSMPRGGRR